MAFGRVPFNIATLRDADVVVPGDVGVDEVDAAAFAILNEAKDKD
jgi:hypothetical protein